MHESVKYFDVISQLERKIKYKKTAIIFFINVLPQQKGDTVEKGDEDSNGYLYFSIKYENAR